jgi:O-antigen/teichoic acid export membrane protein
MIAVPFILNTLANFVVGLLVAKFLGPAEYGRYAIATSIGVMLQSIGLDWLRLSASRFCSDRRVAERPEIERTIALLFVGASAIALGVAAVALIAGVDLWLSPALLALAIVVGLANGLYELGGALLRARFRDRGYWRLVLVKGLICAVTMLGAAWVFQSAKAALIAFVGGAITAVAMTGADRYDPKARLAAVDLKLARRFAAYALPLVLASVLYQGVPMLNRYVVWRLHGDAEAGQFALAFDTGSRIIFAIGSALDVLLFRSAVRAEALAGAEAGRGQISRNVGIIFAILTPAVAGCWLVLPSFEHLVVPESFRGDFGQYFTLLLPAFVSIALTSFCVGPVFQMAYRPLPLVAGGAAALLANGAAIAALSQRLDTALLALAQSGATLVGLATTIAFLAATAPARVNIRDIAGALAGTAIMLLMVAPMRGMAPGVLTLLAQAFAGAIVYAGVALALDVCQLRGLVIAWRRNRRASDALAIGASSAISRSTRSKTASP